MNLNKKLYDAARWYSKSFGFSIIPLLRNKKPAIEWLEFQKRKATNDEFKVWFLDKGYMLGIVTGSVSGLTVVDVDNDNGKSYISRVLHDIIYAPFVSTPRGGFHLYYSFEEGVRNKASVSDGVDIRSEGGYVVAPPSINEQGVAYKWDKQQILGKVSLQNLPSELKSVLLEPPQKSESSGTIITDYFVEGRRDNDLFHTANCLIKGGMDARQAEVVVEAAANACKPPFPVQEVHAKIQSAMQRAVYRERNLADEIKDWIASYKGIFLSSEMARALQINNKDQVKELARVLNKLSEEGYIERYGKRAGVFRKVERDFKAMDWLNAEVKTLDINYPLQLHKLFVTYPKNIVVVCGVKDSGKTAFMLDFIKRNHSKFPINYFTNEMSSEELKMRLLQHKDISITDWKFKAYEIGGAWEDAIDPDAITVIDYIEINNNFWEIGEIIKGMHERLNKGLILLGLQKKYGALLGRGAEFSLQRPRLYVTLDGGIATIVSAKNRIPGGPNVVGWTMAYEVVDGWKIRHTGEWRHI